MSGRYHYAVLRNAFSRQGLMDHGVSNGVQWDEDSHEGVNWMRFSRSLCRHLNDDKPFHTDNLDLDTIKKMHSHYTQLRDLHVKAMIPHVKEGLRYLQQQDVNTHKHPNEYLPEVYKHLKENGGHHWNHKIRTLVHINSRLKALGERMTNMTPKE